MTPQQPPTESIQHNLYSMMKQIFGKRNIFGYSSTIVNQIHLMYWFLGDFYLSRVFNTKIKRFWMLFNVINGTSMLLHCLSNMILSSDLEISKILHTIEVIITVIYFVIITPLGTYIHRKSTKEAFKILDRDGNFKLRPFPNTDVQFVKHDQNHETKLARTTLIVQICLMSGYFVCMNIHFIVGYSKEKLKDSNYYLYPIYYDHVDTLRSYFAILFTQIISSLPTLVPALLIPYFSVASVNEFHRRFRVLSDFLDHHSEMFTRRYEKLLNASNLRESIKVHEKKLLVESFSVDIRRCAKYHRNLPEGIHHLKPYLQFNMSTSVAMFLYVEVMLLYISILFKSESFILQIKILNYAAGMCTIFYVNCMIGNLFMEMGNMFRTSVYNIPWYYLPPSERKSAYLLLYQAQATLEFKALKVFPVNMELFLKISRYVYSIVNVLRKYH